VLDHLKGLNLKVVAMVASEASTGRDETGNLRFFNKRSEVAWRMREALDPTADDPIALPPDQELLGDLVALRFKIVRDGQRSRHPGARARTRFARFWAAAPTRATRC
jgi:hypothetical protein